MATTEASIEIVPRRRPIGARVALPGSKSYTNRVLPVAALARGRSDVRGALFSDDTLCMLDALRALGIQVEADPANRNVAVRGCDGDIPVSWARVHAGDAGTVARFLAPVMALGHGEYEIDASPRMRERPMGPLLSALEALGGSVQCIEGGPPNGPRLPVRITARGLRGGRIKVPGDQSSQFITGLLLSAPYMTNGLVVEIDGELVSRPYLDMTGHVMSSFGVDFEMEDYRRFEVRAGRTYLGHTYQVEPDASAASYFFAAAAICGGWVRVPGLGWDSLQGDLQFVRVLERMGATVTMSHGETEVRSGERLRGVDADLADLSDTAPTLAVVAAFADTPTRIRGIGFVRSKESDRIGDVVCELQRLGIDAHEEDDGMVVNPGIVQAGAVATHDDHRIAMSFALFGLTRPGIRIENPGCVSKTFPDYFSVLASLA